MATVKWTKEDVIKRFQEAMNPTAQTQTSGVMSRLMQMAQQKNPQVVK